MLLRACELKLKSALLQPLKAGTGRSECQTQEAEHVFFKLHDSVDGSWLKIFTRAMSLLGFFRFEKNIEKNTVL